MDLKFETLTGMRLIAKPEYKQNYEWDIIVPDSKPDILKIITAEGFITLTSKDVMQDRAVLNGNIRINLIYLAADENNSVKNIECVQPFNYVMEIKGLKPGMKLCVYNIIDKISANIINSRKLNVNVYVCFMGEAYEDYSSEYIENIEDSCVKCKCENATGLKLVDCIDKSFTVSDDYEIPSGKSSAEALLSIKPDFTHCDIKNANGKFVIRGNVCIASVYNSVSENDGIQYMINETPVNEIVECDSVSEDNILDGDVKVSNFNYILKENSDGEKRIIKYSCDVNINGKVYDTMSITPVVDAYGTTKDLKVQKESCLLDKYEKVDRGQFAAKDILYVDKNKEIQRVICTDVEAFTDKITKESSGLKLNGHILVDLLYQSIDGELCYIRREMQFDHFIDTLIDNYPVYDVQVNADSCSYNILSSDSIEMRVNICYKVIARNKLGFDFVNKLEAAEKNKICHNGITVVFCDGEEVLWDIAKKYKTTVEEIMTVNGLENENDIIKGMKLLIP